MAQLCERGTRCDNPATHCRDTWYSSRGRGDVLMREYACEAHAVYEPGMGAWVPIFWAREVQL